MKGDIVAIMISQHRDLQEDLDKIKDLVKAGIKSSKAIDSGLKGFAKDLTEHLDLENNVFYVQLIKKMEEDKQDTKKTKEFIADMKRIEVVINKFLKKYGDTKSIEKNFETLTLDLKSTIKILNMRIKCEEEGLYAYWNLYR